MLNNNKNNNINNNNSDELSFPFTFFVSEIRKSLILSGGEVEP